MCEASVVAALLAVRRSQALPTWRVRCRAAEGLATPPIGWVRHLVQYWTARWVGGPTDTATPPAGFRSPLTHKRV